MIEINGKKINNVFEAKTEIIKLMKDCCDENKTTPEKDSCKQHLIEFLQECSVDSDLRKEYEEFEDNESEYKYCWYVNSNRDYGYCINKNGMMILLKIESTKQHKQKDVVDKNKFKNDDYIEIKLENGYIDENNGSFKLSTTFDIYEFMKEAGWLDEDQSYILAENLKSDNEDKLEIHHINNRPDDNRVDNLIWLPRSIHCQAHKYSKIYTFELTIDEYEKVDNFIKDIRKNN